MKIERIKIGAVIPVQQYGNLQPEIEVSSEDKGEDVLGAGISVIKDLFSRYSEKGGLKENEVVNTEVKIVKKSFNEDAEIEFEPIGHIYTKDGKELTSATEYIKRFYKPFDADTISSVLESKWGVPQTVIRELWEQNGKLSSIFGNVVHYALEFYEKFKDYGDIISSQTDKEENYCLPKHPILRDIVKGFLALDTPKGKVMTEVLLSDIESGVCGTADRLVIIDEAKKICRVMDYKVNVGSEEKSSNLKASEPFKDLPSNKISKYQLQMSLYANMLQKSGWTVEGVDVFVYENEWKHFPLEVLKVIK